MTTKIILTRHGHVEGIEPQRFRGREDVPLTALGVEQAQATAIRIAAAWPPAAIYTSPLRRCISTGAAIAEACKMQAQTLAALDDMDFGTWQWKLHSEIAKAFPADYATWRNAPHFFRFPEGESLQELVARAADALRFVLQKHADETVVLVAHNNVNRALLLQVLDQPLSAYWRLAFDPCSLSRFVFDNGTPVVPSLNDTSHLAGIRVS